MNDITVITGPMRSGTSCLTGILERCGFDLGRTIRILREPTDDNPYGDLEPDLLLAVNARLLEEAGGNGVIIPDEQALAAVAARREQYFRYVIRKFDGNLLKDPMMCLTLPFWERHWPELRRVVFCLRHPAEVAKSVEKRYDVSAARGLELWDMFTRRFFESAKRCRVYLLDFNAFLATPLDVIHPLLDWLEQPAQRDEIQSQIDAVLGNRHIHWSYRETELQGIPDDIRERYLTLRSQAERMRVGEH